jgi:hypothetical protein
MRRQHLDTTTFSCVSQTFPTKEGEQHCQSSGKVGLIWSHLHKQNHHWSGSGTVNPQQEVGLVVPFSL